MVCGRPPMRPLPTSGVLSSPLATGSAAGETEKGMRLRVGPHAGAVLTLVLAAAAPSRASPGGEGLYSAMVIVTGTDLRSRPAGFARCFREVLVKVSGEPRLETDPGIDAIAAEAADLVESFSYRDPKQGIPHHDDQASYDRSNELTVAFQREKVDAALARLGTSPWRGPRPVLVAAVAVRGSGPVWPGEFALAEGRPEGGVQKASLAASAERYGLEVEVAIRGRAIRLGRAPGSGARPGRLGRSGNRRRRQPDLTPGAIGWAGLWLARWHGQDFAWGVRGVSFDAAFDDLVRGTVRLASGNGAPE